MTRGALATIVVIICNTGWAQLAYRKIREQGSETVTKNVKFRVIGSLGRYLTVLKDRCGSIINDDEVIAINYPDDVYNV